MRRASRVLHAYARAITRDFGSRLVRAIERLQELGVPRAEAWAAELAIVEPHQLAGVAEPRVAEHRDRRQERLAEFGHEDDVPVGRRAVRARRSHDGGDRLEIVAPSE
jgi:hypothetical protein